MSQPDTADNKATIAKVAEIYANLQKAFYEVMKDPKLVHPDLQKALLNLHALGRHLSGEFDGRWPEEAERLAVVANKSLATVAGGAGKRDPAAYIGTEKAALDGKDSPVPYLVLPGTPRAERYAWIPLYGMNG